MKKKVLIWVLVYILIISLVSYGNIKLQPKKPDVDLYNIKLKISDNNSVSIDKNSVTFFSKPGRVVSGSTVINNDGNKTSEVNIKIEGQLAEKNWLKVSHNEFTIVPNNGKRVGIAIRIPSNASGQYEGKLRIESENI